MTKLPYHPSGIRLLNANLLNNNMFQNRTGQKYDYWTYFVPTGGTVVPTYAYFYTSGASLRSSCPASGSKTSSHLTYDDTVSVSTATDYQFFIRYMHSSGYSDSFVEMKYLKSDLNACATSSHLFYLKKSQSWKETRIPIYHHTSNFRSNNSFSHLDYNTSNSFLLPSDCKYIKPKIYFRYSTTPASIFHLDSVKIGKYSVNDNFHSLSTDNVAIVMAETMLFPDTPYCDAHLTFKNTVNDATRGVTGTMVGTANYVSSAYFARFSTAIMYASQSRNYIKNGHFSSSLAKGTSSWTNNGLTTFATVQSVKLFGTRSLKIGATVTNQYISQVPVYLSGSTVKSLSFYAKNGYTDGCKYEGYLSGIKVSSGGMLFSTSNNWQRMIFTGVHTSDTIRIYPYASSLYSGNYCYIQGLQLENMPQTATFVSPYDIEHINGIQTRSRSYTQYNVSLIDKNQGTMEFWFRPQTSYDGQDFQILDWSDISLGGADYWALGFRYFGNGGPMFEWQTNNFLLNGYVSNLMVSTSVFFKPNDLIHVAITWNGTKGELYVNGVPSPDQIKDIFWPDSSVTTFRIGSTNYSFDSLNGYLDEFRLESSQYNGIQILKDSLSTRPNV